jgi:ATP-dependent RNA helicase DeaD
VTDSQIDDVPTGFDALGLTTQLITSLIERGYTRPTPIQAEAIPPIIQGHDLIGLAATGTGKTAAFALPILHRLADAGPNRPQPSVLILVPTRELAIQVAKAVSGYGKPIGVRVVPVYGGSSFEDQARAIRRGGDVVVATPGRALDHLKRGTLPLTGISALVLDEADEMLDMGFAEDLEAILSATPATRQTMLFSATMPPRIAAIAEKYLKNPVRVSVAKPKVAPGEAPKVRQTLFLVPGTHKLNALARVLAFEAPTSAIVFCRTRQEVDGVTEALAGKGHLPQALHGGLSQDQRDRVMRNFREGATTILVATDVAARGLDIGHLSHVINFGVPLTAETYVHRIGRVGRAGRDGVALTLAEPREQMAMRNIERVAGCRPASGRVPTNADLGARRLERLKDGVVGLMGSEDLDPYRETAVALLATGGDPATLIAAAFALAARTGQPSDDGPDVPVVAPPRSGPPLKAGRQNDSRARRSRPGTERVFINAGRATGFDRRDVIKLLEREVGLGSNDIGNVEIYDRHTLVDVSEMAAEEVIDRLSGARVRGRRILARRDRAAAGYA